jgi:hypothetical protein
MMAVFVSNDFRTVPAHITPGLDVRSLNALGVPAIAVRAMRFAERVKGRLARLFGVKKPCPQARPLENPRDPLCL